MLHICRLNIFISVHFETNAIKTDASKSDNVNKEYGYQNYEDDDEGKQFAPTEFSEYCCNIN